MLKITRLADYSILILCCFDKDGGKKVSAPKLASLTGLSLPTVNKILSKLVKGKILTTTRGSRGGYMTTKNFEDISINDIIEILEGPVAITNCISKQEKECNLIDICITKKAWGLVNSAIVKTLQDIKIKDINSADNFLKIQ